MKINANLLNSGNIIKYKEKPFKVLKTNIIKPGKGGAYIQVEMRDLTNGLKTNERWRTSESIEKLSTEEIKTTFLFLEKENITLMNNENYEQFQVELSIIKNKEFLLEDGMQLIAEVIDNKIIDLKFPKSVEVTIETADSVVKGQTASTSFKNAITSKGLKLLVPPHIKQNDKILINSDDFSYIEKSKK